MEGSGAGVSEKVGEFDPLPHVADELKTIVHNETAKNEKGLFSGKRLLNREFTRQNLTDALKRKSQLVHFATHFVLNPGKDIDSFLLLGDGNRLSLAEMRTDKLFDLEGVDLLTLSACETAVNTTTTSGAEIESFGVIAQKRGAKTVISTLWSISDSNTAQLMTEFYRTYQAGNGKTSKAEALRQAQIKLLKKGKTNPNIAHPFYWASFIVVGEWR
ncbi:MAG: CHAT domain-containing protein [Blastocatellia bacterium]|nr:CHAT domain-containing protein [Blastocatellia bacterium]